MTRDGKQQLEVDFQPFLRLGKYLSEEFMVVAEELLFLVSAYGMSKTPSEPTNEEELGQFFAHVHDGWKQAQVRIAELLTDALVRQAAAQAGEKEQHRQRNKKGQLEAKRKSHQIRVEIHLLRRTLDVALWTMVQGEHSTLRRLFVVDGNNSLSSKNIAEAMPVANEINEKPLAMALCTDMLSMVHVGDLVVIDRESGQITFVELKSGHKNYVISKAAEFAVESECQAFEHFATADFDQKDAKHYERVKRQAKRNQAIVKTIQEEGGVDQNTGAKVQIEAMGMPPEFWSDAIVECYEQLSPEKKWAIKTIDECVHIGVYSDHQMAFVRFKAWMSVLKCDSPIYNLTDSFRMPWVRPLGATLLPFDLMKQILRGDILVIICLDIQNMIEAVNARQPEFLGLISAQETSKARLHRIEMLEMKGQGVRATLGDLKMDLGAGFRDRVVFDQHSPLQIVYDHLQKMSARQESTGADAPTPGDEQVEP